MKEPVTLGRDDPLAEPDRLADDATLIARSRTEPEAFAAIFGRHATEIHRYAARRLGPAFAEDVVGETFLVAFRRRDRYDLSYRDARPWLFGIATNMIGRHRRAEVRFYRALARTGVDPVIESPADDVVARVAAVGQRRTIAAALAALSPEDRDTVLLVDWAELSYDQAASALRVPVGTVRSRLNRARRKVREALGGINPILPTPGDDHE
jgi:RNA polymerase sigma-70 factor (ECF subfamily)